MEQTKLRFVRLRRYVWWLAAIWTVVLSGSLVWNLVSHNMEIKDLALNTARLTIEKDLLLRQWGASHGGVYVPVTAATQPNPYLSQIPERDISTPSGRLLTLVNPAYMTRQIYEMAQQRKTGVPGHITSLRPISPINAPDAWETGALKALEREQAEIFSIVEWEGKSFLRLIKPFRTEKSCLKCHAAHGYKEGDLQGGISISIPLDTLTGDDSQIFLIWLSHGFIWLLGLGLIGFDLPPL